MSTTNLSDLLSDADQAALYRPAGEALGLPGSAYSSEFFALEQRSLFPRTWCAVGFASDIPEPGDAYPVDLAGWPLLLVRGVDRKVRAFHNVCRHRANRVVDAPCRELKRLVCPWHNWTYELDGSLAATPRLGGERLHHDEGFDTEGLGLKAVATAVWLDMVLVNLDGNALPFDAHIRPLEEELSRYQLDDIRVGAHWDITFEGNWKVTIEGAIEDYHIPAIHPQLWEGMRADPRLEFAAGCYVGQSKLGELSAHDKVMVDEGARPPSLVRDGAEARSGVLHLFPTALFTVMPESLWLWVIQPVGPRRTRLDTREYYRGEAATDPAFARVRQATTEVWRDVMAQDEPLIVNVQANMDRPGDAGIRPRFSPFWEANVQRFQQLVVDTLRAAEA